jgi:hypothetical protein
MLLDWLTGMKALTPELQKFIKQDIDNILPAALNAVQQAVTDVAGAVGTYILGKGARRRLHTISDE